MQRSISFSAGLGVLAACSLQLGLAGTARAAVPLLAGSVGPGFTISLKNAGGKVVKTLKAGRYTITVRDQASIHDFHLFGPGFDKTITSVPFTGAKSITVKLRKGTYRFLCDPHASIMHGSFKVS